MKQILLTLLLSSTALADSVTMSDPILPRGECLGSENGRCVWVAGEPIQWSNIADPTTWAERKIKSKAVDLDICRDNTEFYYQQLRRALRKCGRKCRNIGPGPAPEVPGGPDGSAN